MFSFHRYDFNKSAQKVFYNLKPAPRRPLALKTFLRLALKPSLHGDCSNPIFREVHALDAVVRKHFYWSRVETVIRAGIVGIDDRGINKARMLTAGITVRCRKCSKCLEQKKRAWRARAFYEFGQADRTWFVTYTMGFHARLAADLSGNPEKWMLREMQLYLKRLRLDVGFPLRFLCVVEPHKDGTPHLHLLIHDVKGRIVKRAIQRHWIHGFTSSKLADKESIRYVTKYVTKALSSRVRASIRYGTPRE